jgi:hypothetical protein
VGANSALGAACRPREIESLGREPKEQSERIQAAGRGDWGTAVGVSECGQGTSFKTEAKPFTRETQT